MGWAGGSNGPDYFIYLGDGPAGWLGNPHDGTIFAEVSSPKEIAPLWSECERSSLFPRISRRTLRRSALRSRVCLALRSQVADEASMEVAGAISRIPLGRETKPGEMHLLGKELRLAVSSWAPIAGL